jgi:hypothetical protein
MGGVWLYREGATPADITAKYPDLTVFESRPLWMTDQEERLVRTKFSDPAEKKAWLDLLSNEPKAGPIWNAP